MDSVFECRYKSPHCLLSIEIPYLSTIQTPSAFVNTNVIAFYIRVKCIIRKNRLNTYLVNIGWLDKAPLVPPSKQDHLALSHPQEDATSGPADFSMGCAGSHVLAVLHRHLAAVRLGAQHLATYQAHGLWKKKSNILSKRTVK